MQLLGTRRSKEVLDVSSLVRGHLSPDGDFLWAPHQWATYFYANVAPQFSSINGGHWKVVENLARKLAAQVTQSYTYTCSVLATINQGMPCQSAYFGITFQCFLNMFGC